MPTGWPAGRPPDLMARPLRFVDLLLAPSWP